MFTKNILSVFFPLVIAGLISWVLNNYTVINSPDWYFGILFFSIFCFTINIIYSKTAHPETFTQQLMVGIVIKLLLTLSCIILYKLFFTGNFFYFSIHFITHYILFTIFEIRYLLYIVKKEMSLKSIKKKP